MTPFINGSRKDRLIHERVHDPYKTTRKPSEPSVCPKCNAVFKGGRWQWLESWPTESHKVICQACRRIRDNYPAGVLMLSGDFLKTNAREVLNLARNEEKAERVLHPLHRIIKVEKRSAGVFVSTTDIHLPKRIGQALRRAYKGRLEMHYEKASCFVLANWISNPE